MAVKMITMGQLKPGDIILSTTDASVSKIVKFATNSRFSHARLYLGGNKIMEAVDPKVREYPLSDALKEDLYAEVFRMPDLTENQKAKIIHYAREQSEKEYDMSGAIGSSSIGTVLTLAFTTFENDLNPTSDFYCSELVAFAYKSAGIILNPQLGATTPNDLARNKKLVYVGHLKMSGM